MRGTMSTYHLSTGDGFVPLTNLRIRNGVLQQLFAPEFQSATITDNLEWRDVPQVYEEDKENG